MIDSLVLQKLTRDSSVFVKSDVLVQFKGFDFRFRREPDDFVPDDSFIPLVWVKKDDSDEGDNDNDGDDDVMDTSDAPLEPPRSSALHEQPGGSGSLGAGGARTVSIAVTPFCSNPQTKLAKEMVAKLRALSPGLERQSPRSIVSAHDLRKALAMVSPQPSTCLQGSSSASGSSSDRPARGEFTRLGV
jgi:hypothetical protein